MEEELIRLRARRALTRKTCQHWRVVRTFTSHARLLTLWQVVFLALRAQILLCSKSLVHHIVLLWGLWPMVVASLSLSLS